MAQERWQLTGSGAASYERYQVPSVFAPLARLFLRRIPLGPGQRVLDVACGTGILARQAASVLGPAGVMVGVDLNPLMLDIARERAPSDAARLEWRKGDALSLPCADAEFDIVLCQQGLQFFPDKAGALGEMHRVLKPRGLAGLAVWRSVEHSPCHLAIAAALRRYIGAETVARFQAPFGFGDEAALRRTMAAAGFRHIEIHVDVVMRRLLPPEESIPGLLASTPIAPEIAALDESTRAAIVDETATALAQYRDADGLTVPQPTHVVLARK